jgi:peroxiredoxin
MPIMNKTILVTIFLAAGAGGGFFAAARFRAKNAQFDVAPLLPPDEHLVTAEVLAKTAKLSSRPALAFEAQGTDGKTHSLDSLTKSGPIVMIFIKIGCPCSVAAQAYFNQVMSAYRGHAHFVGVIDGDIEAARRWAKANRVKHLLLLDPELKIIKEYQAESSVYVALIDSERRIDAFWPGYSKSMLVDLSDRLGHLCGVSAAVVDTTNAPGALSTGCTF